MRGRGRGRFTACEKTWVSPLSTIRSTSASVASGFTMRYCRAIWSRYLVLNEFSVYPPTSPSTHRQH